MVDFEISVEQKQILKTVRKFVENEVRELDFNELEYKEDPYERVPWSIVEKADEIGLRTLTAPEEYGGIDADSLTLCLLQEELARGDMGIAVIFAQTWKVARGIANLGTEAQKEWFFPKFMNDPRHTLAITITEPDRGGGDIYLSVPSKQNTRAKKEGDEWIINGHKVFSSNAADAKTYLVYAQTRNDVPAPLGTTRFLVPREAEGLETGHIHEKIGQRLVNNAELVFNDLRVPNDMVLGEPHKALLKIDDLLSKSNTEAAATTLGVAQAAFEEALKYSQERVQGGKPLIEHQEIGVRLAKMGTKLEAARSLLWKAAWACENMEPLDYKLPSMAKWYCSEVSAWVCRQALECFGGSGIMRDLPMEKYLRDAITFLHSDGAVGMHQIRVKNKLAGKDPIKELQEKHLSTD